ncbi:MAG: Uma2 family endonuclease [Bryobacteraceae bacterium]
MQAATLVTVEEYLATSYRPDVEYLEGLILERHVGEHTHSRAQGLILHFLASREREWRIHAVPEQRVQVSATRFRVPDVCVILTGSPIEEIYRTPPFLCIEILSRDDTMTEMQERVDDYLAMGVAHVWVIDPRRCRAYAYTSDGMREIAGNGALHASGTDISIPLAAIFDPVE